MRIACVGWFPPEIVDRGPAAQVADRRAFATADEALRLPRESQPDVWVTEVLLPGVSGLELARRLSARPAAAPVLILTALKGVWPLARAIRAGARGYLPLSLAPQLLADALTQLASGAPFWKAPDRRDTDEAVHSTDIEALSPRQFEVLHLLLQGFGPAEMARAMSVSPRSAAAYRRQLSRALGLGSRADLDGLARLLSEPFYRPQAAARAPC